MSYLLLLQIAAVGYASDKAMSGYSSNQPSAVVGRDHSWHGTGHASSKQHSYGSSTASATHWASRGTASSAAVSSRSEWSGRGGSSSAAGGGSYASSAKMGMSEASRSAAASSSSRANPDVRYDAYKPVANSATRRY